MKSIVTICCFLLVLVSSVVHSKSLLTFPSKDGLQITFDSYITKVDKRPLIVLFHQAGYSRGEYIEIAPKLNKLGFNVLAVDLRSGKSVNNVTNETAKRARKAGKKTNYVNAEQDVIASLEYARSLVGDKVKIVAWGSSYSAALVLKVGGDHPELANVVMAFSPGEYFKKSGKAKDWIQKSARLYTRAVFITSARSEKKQWSSIFNAINSKKKFSFLPKGEGKHGSKALWEQQKDSDEYWVAVTRFLKSIK